MVIVTKPGINSKQNRSNIECNINPGSNGSLMPLNIFKILYPGATMEQLAKHKDKCITLQMYNKSSILQLEVWTVTIKHNNKQKLCRFF